MTWQTDTDAEEDAPAIPPLDLTGLEPTTGYGDLGGPDESGTGAAAFGFSADDLDAAAAGLAQYATPETGAPHFSAEDLDAASAGLAHYAGPETGAPHFSADDLDAASAGLAQYATPETGAPHVSAEDLSSAAAGLEQYDPANAIFATRKEEREAELDALRAGQAPAPDYLGQPGYQQDARLMAQDPRMQARDEVAQTTFESVTSQAAGTFNVAHEEGTEQVKDAVKEALADNIKTAADLTKEAITGHVPDLVAEAAHTVVDAGLGAATGAAVGALSSGAKKLAKKITGLDDKAIPGADYDRRDMTTGDKAREFAADAAVTAGTTILGAVPVVGTGVKIASAVKSGQREKTNKKLAKLTEDEGRDEAQTTLMEGLAKGHKQEKIDRAIDATVSGVGDIATAASLGGAAVAAQGIKAAGAIGKVVAKTTANIVDMATSDEVALRREAQLPARPDGMSDEDYQALVDASNESLIGLSAESAGRARGQLDYLAEGQMSLDKELYVNKDIQKPRSTPIKRLVDGEVPADVKRTTADKVLRRNKPPATAQTEDSYTLGERLADKRRGTVRAGHGTGEAVEEPNLKPSRVAELAQQERARLRQRERMGAAPTWDMEADKEAERTRKAAEKEAKAAQKEAKRAGGKGKTVRFADAPTPPPAPAPDVPEPPTFLDEAEAAQVAGRRNVLKDALKNQKKNRLLDS